MVDGSRPLSFDCAVDVNLRFQFSAWLCYILNVISQKCHRSDETTRFPYPQHVSIRHIKTGV